MAEPALRRLSIHKKFYPPARSTASAGYPASSREQVLRNESAIQCGFGDLRFDPSLDPQVPLEAGVTFHRQLRVVERRRAGAAPAGVADLQGVAVEFVDAHGRAAGGGLHEV